MALATPPKSLSWVDHLNRAETLEQLQANLKAHHPLIDVGSLKKINIIGAAEEGQRLVSLCDSLGIEIENLCDDHPAKISTRVGSHEVRHSDALDNADKSIPVVIASHRVLRAVEALEKKEFKSIVPFALLQVLAGDQFSPHMFYEGWLEALINNKEKLAQLRGLLNDDKSLDTLNAVIGFRLSLDATVLAPIIDWSLYGSELLNLGENEVYIDCGCFDGDTIKIFIDRVNGKFEKIIGFEPDTNTFKKLKSNFPNDNRIKLINKGAYSHQTTLRFDNAGTRGSILCEEEGVIEVPVTSIDTVLSGDRVTYIKMNIEGAELAALKGAASSIAKYKPKLAISAYHYPTDLWEIAFLIKELNPEYQFYLRQHDGGVIETVLYAI